VSLIREGMIHQLRYRFSYPPTERAIELARSEWLAGRKTPGVVITPICWAREQSDTRAAVETGYIGKAGIVKYEADPRRTLCDYDTVTPPSLELVYRIARMLEIKPVLIEYNRTRRGWHLIITWNRRFKPIEIVALQCCLHSDIRRETFNLARVFSGKARSRRWNILFERKLTKGRTQNETN
jgi:hypothetical protein